MSDVILHHYAASPFSEKVRTILGFKGMAWRSVTIPAIMPKPDLTALTGGYRKTPVLQLGCDVYCDTRLIARKLEELKPSPSIYPPQQLAFAMVTSQWADQELFKAAVAFAFQPAALQQFVAELTPEELQGFAKDRAALAQGGNSVPAMHLAVAHGHMPAYLGQLDAQLEGRDYLGGDSPCIADFSVYHCLWFFHQRLPEELAPYPALLLWMARMGELGHGQSTPMEAEQALEVCKQASPLGEPSPLQNDRNATALGQAVRIKATDYGVDPVEGTLVYLAEDEMAVERQDPRAGNVVVHFPRVGFSLRGLDG